MRKENGMIKYIMLIRLALPSLGNTIAHNHALGAFIGYYLNLRNTILIIRLQILLINNWLIRS